jgi:hypothetical protein
MKAMSTLAAEGQDPSAHSSEWASQHKFDSVPKMMITRKYSKDNDVPALHPQVPYWIKRFRRLAISSFALAYHPNCSDGVSGCSFEIVEKHWGCRAGTSLSLLYKRRDSQSSKPLYPIGNHGHGKIRLVDALLIMPLFG